MRIIFASRSDKVLVSGPSPAPEPLARDSELNSKGRTRMALAGTPGPPGPPAGGRESDPPGYGPPSPPAPCRRRRLKPSLIIKLAAPPSSYRPRLVLVDHCDVGGLKLAPLVTAGRPGHFVSFCLLAGGREAAAASEAPAAFGRNQRGGCFSARRMPRGAY
jgi:hypothetical protein